MGKTDFTQKGCALIGNKILKYAYSARDLAPYYRTYMRAYFRDALQIIDESLREQTTTGIARVVSKSDAPDLIIEETE